MQEVSVVVKEEAVAVVAQRVEDTEEVVAPALVDRAADKVRRIWCRCCNSMRNEVRSHPLSRHIGRT